MRAASLLVSCGNSDPSTIRSSVLALAALSAKSSPTTAAVASASARRETASRAVILATSRAPEPPPSDTAPLVCGVSCPFLALDLSLRTNSTAIAAARRSTVAIPYAQARGDPCLLRGALMATGSLAPNDECCRSGSTVLPRVHSPSAVPFYGVVSGVGRVGGPSDVTSPPLQPFFQLLGVHGLPHQSAVITYFQWDVGFLPALKSRYSSSGL